MCPDYTSHIEMKQKIWKPKEFTMSIRSLSEVYQKSITVYVYRFRDKLAIGAAIPADKPMPFFDRDSQTSSWPGEMIPIWMGNTLPGKSVTPMGKYGQKKNKVFISKIPKVLTDGSKSAT